MAEDSSLIGLVSITWIALAGLYAFVPMFDMPGSAVVWGSGALVFLVLAFLVVRAQGRAMAEQPRINS